MAFSRLPQRAQLASVASLTRSRGLPPSSGIAYTRLSTGLSNGADGEEDFAPILREISSLSELAAPNERTDREVVFRPTGNRQRHGSAVELGGCAREQAPPIFRRLERT
jgi:hypothetical protein